MTTPNDRRPSKPQVEARRPSQPQVQAPRRPSKVQLEDARQPRTPSSPWVDPQQARRTSNKLFTSVAIVNYMDVHNLRKPEQPSTISSSLTRNPGWYLKRCCVCLLLLVSTLTIAVAIYVVTGPAGKWFTNSEETTSSTEPLALEPVHDRSGGDSSGQLDISLTTQVAKVRRGVPAGCEVNSTVDHCPAQVLHTGVWYVCPGNNRPCRPAWKAEGRCLGPRGPRFSTQTRCERHCFKEEDPCQTGPESCPCTDDYRDFNYVHTKDKGCIPLEKGRCLAKNIPGHKSKADCLKLCQGETMRGAMCDLEEVNTDRCTWRNKIYSFYYDVQKKSCLPWNDDICQPNVFSSIELCMQICK
ncbi:uncharacterized protein LOC135401273 isoform X2 [Ornithodoros turicata]|uniref:uncharacterized protein LOC135401273 isoform X2 n=1 Tax=Ornithodoros turicata TaxID=34597 RepID=UPI0031398407